MITAEKTVKDLDNYYGKAVILKYLLNDEYEIEVQMPLNWKEDELPDILANTFVEAPKKIHILSIDTDKRLLN